MTPTCATVLGITLQLIGAMYLVYQAKKTARSLAEYKGQVMFDEFSPAIEALAKELSSQYSQQLVGFLFLFAGSAFQLYATVA